jgi:hypothetical protein
VLKSPLALEPFTGGSLDDIGNSQCIANAIKNDIGEMSVGSTLIGSENMDGIDGYGRGPPPIDRFHTFRQFSSLSGTVRQISFLSISDRHA